MANIDFEGSNKSGIEKALFQAKVQELKNRALELFQDSAIVILVNEIEQAEIGFITNTHPADLITLFNSVVEKLEKDIEKNKFAQLKDHENGS